MAYKLCCSHHSTWAGVRVSLKHIVSRRHKLVYIHKYEMFYQHLQL